MTGKHKCSMRKRELKFMQSWGYIKASYPGVHDKKLCYIARLLNRTAIKYAEFNALYREKIKEPDFPMGWGELQNQGIIFHSIYEALQGNGTLFGECPYEVKKYKSRRKITRKRIDYWVYVKNQCILLIEYKHNCIEEVDFQKWFGPEDNSPLFLRSIDRGGWKRDIRTLREHLNKSYVRKFLSLPEVRNHSIINVMLMVIPIYKETVDEKKNVTADFGYVEEDKFEKHIDEIVKNLIPNPVWNAYWWLPENRQREIQTWNEKTNYYHNVYRGVYFVAWLEKVQ